MSRPATWWSTNDSAGPVTAALAMTPVEIGRNWGDDADSSRVAKSSPARAAISCAAPRSNHTVTGGAAEVQPTVPAW